MRQWRGCGILALGIGIMVLLLYVGARVLRHEGGAGHAHRAGVHGGTLVPVGDDEDHYHVEVVLEATGGIQLYMLGEETDKVVDIELQTLQATVNRTGGKPISVALMPMPQSGDAEGRTSRFVGKLPRDLWGEPLEMTVTEVTIVGKRFQLQFTSPESHEPETGSPALARDEEQLFLTPGGKYTRNDIEANGTNMPSRKYQGFRANHDVRPKRGEKICPVTRTKANPTCTWVINGAVYEFCCPPCIDEFVRRAKEQPEKIKAPEKYVKK